MPGRNLIRSAVTGGMGEDFSSEYLCVGCSLSCSEGAQVNIWTLYMCLPKMCNELITPSNFYLPYQMKVSDETVAELLWWIFVVILELLYGMSSSGAWWQKPINAFTNWILTWLDITLWDRLWWNFELEVTVNECIWWSFSVILFELSLAWYIYSADYIFECWMQHIVSDLNWVLTFMGDKWCKWWLSCVIVCKLRHFATMLHQIREDPWLNAVFYAGDKMCILRFFGVYYYVNIVNLYSYFVTLGDSTDFECIIIPGVREHILNWSYFCMSNLCISCK